MEKDKRNQILSMALYEQYGAAIQMLENVIKKCPEDIWNDRAEHPPFWQVVFHTLWFLDFYLERTIEGRQSFTSQIPQLEPSLKTTFKDVETISSQELLFYLDNLKEKTRLRFESFSLEEAINASVFEWHGNSVLSSLVYNLRHVMLHIGSLHSRLLRKGIKLDNWVSKQVFSN